MFLWRKGMNIGSIIDLSHIIKEGMPVYPGTEPPLIIDANTLEKEGFAEKKITLYSHTGTHMDAPCHIIEGAASLDELDIGHFAGSAIVLDVSGASSGNIGLDLLMGFEQKIEGMAFVILSTGWSRFWGTDQYFSTYPVLTVEAAEWLSGFSLKGVGIDTISMDKTGSISMPVHKAFLNKNIVIIENLTNLEMISGHVFTFCCLPLRIEASDGSPLRAIAILNDNKRR
jgi:arylformamidase